MTVEQLQRSIGTCVRTVPDFPTKGIQFKDITPVLQDPILFDNIMRYMASLYNPANVTHVAAIESRGFIFGAAFAHTLKLPFIPIRKAGKLPRESFRASYKLEYGEATLEVHKDAFPRGARVLVVDDVLATGGTMTAAFSLVRACHATVVGGFCLLKIDGLPVPSATAELTHTLLGV